MENFNNGIEQQQPAVKEKNIYLLHLDGKRIFILSAILIGIVVTSFLIGIKYTSADSNQTDDIFAQNENEVSEKSSSLDDIFKSGDNDKIDEISLIDNKKPESASLDDSLLKDSSEEIKSEKPEADILAKTESKVIEPEKKAPVKSKIKLKKVARVNKKPVKKVVKRKAIKPKKVARKRTVKPKKNVIEVSGRVNPSDLSGYAIQVASYDKRSKAVKEIQKLKSSRYDAYSDVANVDGTNFYRVRIGPMKSKREALNMLYEIQENSRYAESYMVKQ